jgi:hypothetical protein
MVLMEYPMVASIILLLVQRDGAIILAVLGGKQLFL